MTDRPLVIGLGSPHGDDQAGWLVIARLLERGASPTVVRAVAHPAQLWDWWEAGQALIVCDLSLGDGPPGTIHRRVWPHDPLPHEPLAGTHDMPLTEVLRLGAALDDPPREVVVWTISGGQCEAATGSSRAVSAAAQSLGDALWEQLRGE